MRHSSIVAIVGALALGGCLHAPMPWSPDGKWLAYVVEVRPIAEGLGTGWLFGSIPSDGPGTRRSPTPTGYRLWATRADTGASVLLEESSGPMTAPGWSPDGRALAFGRVVPAENGPGRFEVVILEGPTRRRVVVSRALPVLGSEASRLPGQAVAWSPDGRYLAVPQLGPDGLAIVRADNGRVVNTIHDAFLPSWSPDGSRLAFFVRGPSDALHCIDSALGQSRLLAEVGQASQAPAWTRDGLTVMVVARQPAPRDGDAPGDRADLVRVRVDTGLIEPIRSLSGDQAMGRDRTLEGVSIAFDRSGENLFCSTVVKGQPHQISWIHPRDNSVYKKFAILDYTAPMGSLSLSPDGRTLAARVGSLDRLTPPALCDLDGTDPRSRLIAPDDESRVEWIVTLVDSARAILGGLPVPTVPGRDPVADRIDRPTLLPVLGEFEANSESTSRLRRIGRMGRPLCDRPAGSPPAGPELAAVLDEARLFFDYLKEDYSAALTSLETLEARVDSPDRRLRLLSVRAQIFLAMNNPDRAIQTIRYLRGLEARPTRRLEATGSGFTLSTESAPGRGWPDYLEVRVAFIQSALKDEGPDHHANPDNPAADLDLSPRKLNRLFPDRPFLADPPPPGPPGGFRPPRMIPDRVPKL